MIRTACHTLDSAIDRVLIISDLHSHIAPLNALDDVFESFGDRYQVIFNGDLFYGGPHPVETAAWVMAHVGEFATLGNHDDAAIASRLNGELHPPFTEAGAYQRLDQAQRDYFESRPHRLEIEWRGQRIVLMHGHLTVAEVASSWSATPAEQIATFLDTDFDLCVTSHTHYAFVSRQNGTLYANSGSVSAPIVGYRLPGESRLHTQSGHPSLDEHGDAYRCSMLSVTVTDGVLDAEIIRFDYNRDDALADLELAGEPHMAMYREWFESGIINLI